MSQRQLVAELKPLIDHARLHPHSYSSEWVVPILELATRNPRSIRREYVMYNLGPARRRWLVRLLSTAREAARS